MLMAALYVMVFNFTRAIAIQQELQSCSPMVARFEGADGCSIYDGVQLRSGRRHLNQTHLPPFAQELADALYVMRFNSTRAETISTESRNA